MSVLNILTKSQKIQFDEDDLIMFLLNSLPRVSVPAAKRPVVSIPNLSEDEDDEEEEEDVFDVNDGFDVYGDFDAYILKVDVEGVQTPQTI